MLTSVEKCLKGLMLVTQKFKDVSKKAYASNPEKFKEASKKAYANDPEKFKEALKKAYASDPDKFKEALKKAYASDPQKFKEAFKKSYKENSAKHKLSFKENYSEHREEICRKKREEYVLRVPNEGLVKSFVKGLISQFVCNPEVKLSLTLELSKQFKSYTEKLSNKLKSKTACRLAAKNLVHQILTLRKANAGKFLKCV